MSAAFREALADFFYNSWRLLPANLVWGAGFVAVLAAISIVGWIGLLGAPLLGVPVAGVYRLAALIARGDSVSFWDAVAAWRAYALPALAMTTVLTIAALALSLNVILGVEAGDIVGWGFATLAFWGLVGVWVYAQLFWPLLVDPRRADASVRERARLAAVLLLAFPGRFALLATLLLVVLAVSTVLVVTLLTVAVAFAALVGTRYVLPAADRFEGRATLRPA